jgi:hypothetical protein
VNFVKCLRTCIVTTLVLSAVFRQLEPKVWLEWAA